MKYNSHKIPAYYHLMITTLITLQHTNQLAIIVMRDIKLYMHKVSQLCLFAVN